ncbi:hypothetical protein Tco_0034359 [Tanacetum coccineum]
MTAVTQALQDPNVKKEELRARAKGIRTLGLLLLMILHEETRNGWRLVIYGGKVGERSHFLSKYFESIYGIIAPSSALS